MLAVGYSPSSIAKLSAFFVESASESTKNMPTTDKSSALVSSASRPLNLRMRADVSARRQSYQGRDYWVLKDPISLKYFRFEEEEYAILQMLDGTRTPEQIKLAFDYQFAPQKISLQEFYQFIGMMFRNCLLVSDATGQGVELQKRSKERTTQELKSTFTNVLAVRFRGFDPDGLLNVMDGLFRWLFTWPTFCAVVMLWIAAAGLLFTHFELFMQKLPGFHDFFAAQNWGWLALVLATTKIVHEFGHGLACKRYGGQCHEMGVMFLVMTPCLYCNVSDSWTLPSKWKRAAIAAAGMYVELILAAIAVFVWWFSQPGIVNQLALNVIFVSSVSTILFNGNPLLRYDGYYIFSDMLEIPNLRQKSTSILQSQLASWTMGIESRPDPFLPTRKKWLFALYSVAAVLYRWFITFSIFWFLYSLLEPYGVKIIGQFIAMFAIWGLIGMPLIQAYRFFSVPGRFGSVNRSRVAISSLVLAFAVIGILMIPIPHFVRCSFIVQPRNAKNVYVDMPGTLQAVLSQPGQQVVAGQPIVKLDNRELDLQITKLEGDVRLAKTRLDTWKSASLQDRTGEAADEAAVAFAELKSAQSDLQQRQQDLGMMTIKSPIAGQLIPPAYTSKSESENGVLPSWHGYPTDARNVGCYLQQGTLVGRLVPDCVSLEAMLTIDQNDIEFVQSGQEVELFPSATPGVTHEAQIDTISTTKMKSVPRALSSRFGGALVAIQSADGEDIPQSSTFQVSVPFECLDERLADGTTGFAKVRAGSQTVGQRLMRLAQKTFRFDL